MVELKKQRLVSDLDKRLEKLLQFKLSPRAGKLFKFVWRSELAARQTDVTAAIAFLDSSRRPAYNAIKELESCGLIKRTKDENLRRRKLLCVTDDGWDILVRATEKYSDIVLNHAQNLEKSKSNWIEFVDSRKIVANSSSPMVNQLYHWSLQRSAEPVPTRFLDRIFVLEYENPVLEDFTVSYWGRGMKLQGGQDFAGQKMSILKKYCSADYWDYSTKAIVNAINGTGDAAINEVRMRFGGKERMLQRVIIPDRPNRRAIIGTWFVEDSQNQGPNLRVMN